MSSQIGTDIIQSPKVAGVTAAIAGGAGLGTLFNYLPPILGIVATMLSIILLIVLIYTRWLDAKMKRRDIKRQEEQDEETKDRIANGEPCRRCGDKLDES